MSDVRGGSENAVFRGEKAEKRPDFFRNQAFLVEISGIEPLTS